MEQRGAPLGSPRPAQRRPRTHSSQSAMSAMSAFTFAGDALDSPTSSYRAPRARSRAPSAFSAFSFGGDGSPQSPELSPCASPRQRRHRLSSSETIGTTDVEPGGSPGAAGAADGAVDLDILDVVAVGQDGFRFSREEGDVDTPRWGGRLPQSMETFGEGVFSEMPSQRPPATVFSEQLRDQERHGDSTTNSAQRGEEPPSTGATSPTRKLPARFRKLASGPLIVFGAAGGAGVYRALHLALHVTAFLQTGARLFAVCALISVLQLRKIRYGGVAGVGGVAFLILFPLSLGWETLYIERIVKRDRARLYSFSANVDDGGDDSNPVMRFG